MEGPATSNQIAAMTQHNDGSTWFRFRGPAGSKIEIEPLMFPGEAIPAIGGSGVILPPAGSDADVGEELVLDFGGDDQAASRGQAVIQMVRDALRDCKDGGFSPAPKAVRQLARLVEVKPEFALRVPELIEYLDWLTTRGAHSIAARILGSPRTGRRRESYLFLVALIDRVVASESCSVAKAASIVERRFGRYFAMSVAAIQNRYAEFREMYRAINGVQYVSGEGLLPYAPMISPPSGSR